jgi:hypothetical protein|tara:strand:- start:166 stop:474 length:309 start_codon:yes stop_codon:yes gene_type:complete
MSRYQGNGTGFALRQIACAAYTEKGGEVLYFTSQFHHLFVEFGDKLIGGHAVHFGNLPENIPELVLKPKRCDHPPDTERTGPTFKQDRVGFHIEFTHGVGLL